MTENEAVERMALAMYRGAGMEQTVSWTVNAESNREEWRGLARLALTSHPAVEALRDLMRRLDEHFGGPDRSEDWIEQANARNVLASLPKEK